MKKTFVFRIHCKIENDAFLYFIFASSKHLLSNNTYPPTTRTELALRFLQHFSTHYEGMLAQLLHNSGNRGLPTSGEDLDMRDEAKFQPEN